MQEVFGTGHLPRLTERTGGEDRSIISWESRCGHDLFPLRNAIRVTFTVRETNFGMSKTCQVLLGPYARMATSVHRWVKI